MDKSNSELSPKLAEEKMAHQHLIADLLKSSLLDKQEISDGYVYAFPGGNDFLLVLITFIRLERVRSPTFKFEFTVRDEKTPILFKISGPDEIKDLLKNGLPF